MIYKETVDQNISDSYTIHKKKSAAYCMQNVTFLLCHLEFKIVIAAVPQSTFENYKFD